MITVDIYNYTIAWYPDTGLISMSRIEKIEWVSYLILIIGFTVDHITTKVGMANHKLYESNMIARTLIELGIWGYVDIVICAIFIYVTYQSYRLLLQREHNYMFYFPLVSGLLRIMVGIQNISLF